MASNENEVRIAVDPASTGLLASSGRRQILADWFVKERAAKARARERIARGLVVREDGSVQTGEEYLAEMRARRENS